ncbi:MAG: winged helix-turn-helix domain-containing protein [Victivallaceae bacterium]|jgi:DNA-binding transcriptional regulator YhcF (GntR family)
MKYKCPGKKSRKKQDAIITAIIRHIGDSGLNPGQKLISERQLAVIFEVQRLTVRRAVKKLCEQGILIQFPQRGTFVAGERTDQSISIVQHGKNSQDELVFCVDDLLPEQVAGWRVFFAALERANPGIKIACKFNVPAITMRSGQWDLALVSVFNLNSMPELRNNGLPVAWFESAIPAGSLNPALVRGVRQFCASASGCYDVLPVGLIGCLRGVNMDIVKTHHLPDPPRRSDWRSLAAWIRQCRKIAPGLIINPVLHSLHNHLFRIDRRIIGPECVNLDFEEVKAFLEFLRSDVTRRFGLDSIQDFKNFLNGRSLICEFFSQFMPAASARLGGNIFLTTNSISPAGGVQLLPRLLAFGKRRKDQAPLLAAAGFFISEQGQRILAEQCLMLPFYGSTDGLSVIREKYQLDYPGMRAEVDTAEYFYESRFFSGEVQGRALNPVFGRFFDGEMSIDETVSLIKSRTAKFK